MAASCQHHYRNTPITVLIIRLRPRWLRVVGIVIAVPFILAYIVGVIAIWPPDTEEQTSPASQPTIVAVTVPTEPRATPKSTVTSRDATSLCANGVAAPNPQENPGLAADCTALLQIRDTLAGSATLNWSADRTVFYWDGITVGESPRRVTRLDLSERSLTGTIPPELAALAHLEVLDLHNNYLSGPIPSELGTLAYLEWLGLAGNTLTGCLPPGLRGVANHDLAGLGLPFCDAEEISEWPHVVGVTIGVIIGMLLILGAINRLRPDAAEEANTTSQPTATAATEPLDSTATPKSGGAVPNSQDNPGLVADCTVLLDARDTLAGSATLNWRTDRPIADWDGITVGGSPPRVIALELVERQLTGTIPPELATLAHLESFSLCFNHLTGPIPHKLGTLAHLQFLILSENQLSGPIPPQLGTLANLQQLGLDSNQLSGPIPPELANLAKLEVLALANNQLSGPIPPELGTIANLWGLWLAGGNALTGCVPPGLRYVADNDFAELGLPFCGD